MLSIAGIVLALVLPQDPPPPAAEPKAPPAYDPLAVAEGDATSLAMSFRDERRDRTIPVRVYLPAATTPAPVIVWSHGLGGSRDNSPYLGTHWSKRGYVCVFLQHPGSDEAVWRDAPPRAPTLPRSAPPQSPPSPPPPRGDHLRAVLQASPPPRACAGVRGSRR
jgi:hypothetical protein